MDGYRRACTLCAGVVLILLGTAGGARAGTWGPLLGNDTTIVGFGAACASGTHRGVDLAAEAGALAVSPAEGTITFAGRVPADGGGTCGALTMELADGQRVSLLPFESVSVATGDNVAPGDELGVVAAAGDDSSGVSHLHVGLRRGDLYLDPGPLLWSPATVGPVEDAPAVPAGVSPSEPVGPGGATTCVAGAEWQRAETPDVAPQPTAASQGVAAPVTPAPATPVARAAGRALIDADVPKTSALVASRAVVRSRGRAHMVSSAGRTTTGWLLVAGMVAAGVGLAVMRRTAPARIH